MTAVAEWDAELDRDLLTGRDLVRFRYRTTYGRGRWSRFVVVPDGDQTIDDIVESGREIVALHAQQEASR